MSKIFYDNLIILEEVEVEVKKIGISPEEKEELWRLIDEIIHNRVLERIFDILPREHHEEFLTKFHEAPYSEKLIQFLNERTGEKIEEKVKEEIKNIESEILKEIRS